MMRRSISELASRDLAWGMGWIRVRPRADGSIAYQAGWLDNGRERTKTFDIQEEAEDWLRILWRAGGGRKTAEERAAERRASYDGHIVYFIQSDSDRHIKIGHARDPIDRLKMLQCGTPSRLRILGIVDGGQSRERALHEQFAHLRVKGEWFKPHPSLLSWIDSNATTLPGQNDDF